MFEETIVYLPPPPIPVLCLLLRVALQYSLSSHGHQSDTVYEIILTTKTTKTIKSLHCIM